jgi:uncharacterized protein (DUF3084 family)
MNEEQLLEQLRILGDHYKEARDKLDEATSRAERRKAINEMTRWRLKMQDVREELRKLGD